MYGGELDGDAGSFSRGFRGFVSFVHAFGAGHNLVASG
jgi:hypothetical protein